LVESLGTAPAELRDALVARSRGLPGLVIETLLVTVARGALRPRGDRLVLDGSVPTLDVESLLDARLAAEGSRCRRVLEAVWSLGERADPASVAQVLPGVSHEAWPHASSARLLMGSGSGRVLVPGAFASRVAERRVSGPGLAARCAALLSEDPSRSTSTSARVASLLEAAEEYQRAGAAWRDVAEAAIGTRDFERAAQAQEGMGRVLRRHPRRDTGEVLAMRLELWARAACMRLALRDLPAARSNVNEGLDAKPTGTTHVELLYACARVAEAEGKIGEAEELVAEALAASSKHPLQAAVLALHAERLELTNEYPRAQDAWHNALALSAAFLPLAPWFGEVDFRGRVEARVGALFISQMQPSRAHSWLISASERFKSTGLPLHAARVMANAGTVSMQLGAFPEAAQWFGAAATQAETGGDFLFQVRQLLALSKVLKRLNDPRLPQVVNATVGLAEALGWDEGVEALRSLGRQGS
jgi:hypothetical protein